jgi:hypothetical protein
MTTTPTKKPLTQIEKNLLEWLKGGREGPVPKYTANTYHGLDRKGYTRSVMHDGCGFRLEFL